MSHPATVHVAAVAPYALTYHATSDGVLPDLSTAISARFLVQHEDGTESEWPATLLNITATAVDLRHVFVPGDLPNPELLQIDARVTNADGEWRFELRQLIVRKAFT